MSALKRVCAPMRGVSCAHLWRGRIGGGGAHTRRICSAMIRNTNTTATSPLLKRNRAAYLSAQQRATHRQTWRARFACEQLLSRHGSSPAPTYSRYCSRNNLAGSVSTSAQSHFLLAFLPQKGHIIIELSVSPLKRRHPMNVVFEV